MLATGVGGGALSIAGGETDPSTVAGVVASEASVAASAVAESCGSSMAPPHASATLMAVRVTRQALRPDMVPLNLEG
jgi:hypothetical protein